MRITELVENTAGTSGCAAEHGLSFYIQTEKHKLLLDAGASGLFAENAKRLGIDLSGADIAVLSHGHYDHGGGLTEFLKINSRAKIYLQGSAFGEHYRIDHEGAEPVFIGLPSELKDSGRIAVAGDTLRIDGELFLFGNIGNSQISPEGNKELHVLTKNGMVRDDFRHEQCLVVTHREKNYLFSGCAHHGILNILERFRELFGKDPDAVLSGFHMIKKTELTQEDLRLVEETAYELKKHDTMFYTGHCTGLVPYEILKKILGDQLEYMHSGDELVFD